MIARGQDRALGGLRQEDWGILLPAQRGQLHGQVWPRNLLCRPSAQPERKSLSVSAPSSPPALSAFRERSPGQPEALFSWSCECAPPGTCLQLPGQVEQGVVVCPSDTSQGRPDSL